MKVLLASMLVLSSVQAFAYSKITLTQSVTAVKTPVSTHLIANVDSYLNGGNDYCEIGIVLDSTEESAVIPAGTTYEVDQNSVFATCENDWGRACGLGLKAYNVELGHSLFLKCKDRGLFATPMTVKKVNKYAGKYISVE